MHYLASWPWLGALVFGVLIAATDPVSVIATFKEAKVQGRLRVLIEAESLFNDGTAAVAFGVLVSLGLRSATHATRDRRHAGENDRAAAFCAAPPLLLVALLLAGQTEDHLVEITFTTVAAYGSFLLADHFGLSGVLATITAGLVMSNFTYFRHDLRPGKGGYPGLLGIRRFRRKFARFPADRNARGASEFPGDLAAGSYRNRACDVG